MIVTTNEGALKSTAAQTDKTQKHYLLNIKGNLEIVSSCNSNIMSSAAIIKAIPIDAICENVNNFCYDTKLGNIRFPRNAGLKLLTEIQCHISECNTQRDNVSNTNELCTEYMALIKQDIYNGKIDIEKITRIVKSAIEIVNKNVNAFDKKYAEVTKKLRELLEMVTTAIKNLEKVK